MAVFPGSIETPFGTSSGYDIFPVDLIGGVDYVASVLGASTAGGTLPNPLVAVFDPNNNLLDLNDDSFALGADPLLQFTAPVNGTYSVLVTDVTGGTGSYQLIVDQNQEPVFFGSLPGEIF